MARCGTGCCRSAVAARLGQWGAILVQACVDGDGDGDDALTAAVAEKLSAPVQAQAMTKNL